MIRRAAKGFSLIEILAAVMIAAAIATIAISQFRVHGDTGYARSCLMTRETIQSEVDRYVAINGSSPSADLSELTRRDYWGSPIPNCPATGTPLQVDRSGRVICRNHP